MASPAGSDPSAGTSGAGDGANGGAFSLGELRAAMDSRVTNARAAVQRRLGSMGVGTSADDARASRMPSVPSITELARRAPKLDLPLIGADDSALLNRVRTGVTRAASGMRRSRTHDSPLSETSAGDDGAPKELPTVWNMAGKPKGPVLPLVNPLPEWDVFKSLKTSVLPGDGDVNGSGDAASTSSNGDERRFPAMWSPPRLAPSVSSESLDNLRRTVEERMAAAAANMPADMRSPGDWLNEMHDAGGKAVKEWLATARDREGKLSQLRESGGGSGTGLFRFTPPPVRGGAKRRASGTFDPAGAGPTSPDENAEAAANKPGGDDEADRGGAESHEAESHEAESREAENREAAAGDAPTTPKEGARRGWRGRRSRRSASREPSANRSDAEGVAAASEPATVSPESPDQPEPPASSPASSSPGEDPSPETSSSGQSGPVAAAVSPAQERRDAGADALTARPRRQSAGEMGFFRRQREDDVSSAGPNGQNGSLRDPGRSVAIVTTASLPWMTGTAVNPLLRAAYLARRGLHEVTLVVPWLTPAEQRMVHPNVIFDTPEEQGEYINKWVKERCGFEPKMKLDFYPGRYATDKYSIIPVGDVSEYISDGKHDVAVLEEPEHLNWYHTGSRWSDKFRHVVGVVHTNYLEYARLEEHGAVKEAAMRFVNSWVSRVHCHKIIKLSDAVQDFPRSETVNIHGVSPVFLEVGRRKAFATAAATAAENDPDSAAASAMGRTVNNMIRSFGAKRDRRRSEERAREGKPPPAPEPEKIRPSTEVFSKGCYFLGKVVWGKGFNELLRRVEEHNTSETGVTHPLKLDVFGNGEDFDDVTARAKQKGLPLKFKGRMDHASDAMHDYKVFINPSLSDVVATTTAEALAMGKYVICAKHPSNEFFSTFPNCMVYETPEQFSQCVKKALSTDPAPLSAKDRYRLSWEAATDRFLDAADIKEEQMRGPGTGLGDKLGETFFAAVHGAAAKHEKMRGVLGAGRGTGRGPKAGELGTWGGVPPQSDQPGFTSTRKKQ